ncbi:hypothetical protein GTP56_05390 [Duganella sp. FT134W]|uniref:Uncharacterized protein n=1 Tax=Duganella margarita TaxID=2692170 RepID=A0A7X4GYL8_9BURK|nr:hypothetical protein [Duganella margarita]MYM71630.1 hypothetical protein [Duganella margarita]
MSSKLVLNAVSFVNSLSKDISGNLVTGQESRVAEYLQIQRTVLEALTDKLEAGSDFKAEQNLENVLKAIDGKLDAMTPYDHEVVDESLKKWAAKGVTLSSLVDRQTA